MSNPKNLAMAVAASKRKKMAKGGEAKSGHQHAEEGKARQSEKAARETGASKRTGDLSNNGNNGKPHPLKYAEGGMIDKKSATTAQRGPKTTKIKHPAMAQSPVFKVRMRDQEDHLETSDAPASPEDEIREPMAEGGEINEAVSMDAAEQDMEQEPEGLASDNDEERPPEDEIMSNRMPMLAEGGEIGMDHHDSIAAAIMARRDRLHSEIDSGAHDLDSAVKMAEGGEVDIDSNAIEQPNGYYDRNEDAALKENYDSDMDSVSDPMDSDERSHDIDGNKHDMVESIRRKMSSKRQFNR